MDAESAILVAPGHPNVPSAVRVPEEDLPQGREDNRAHARAHVPRANSVIRVCFDVSPLCVSCGKAL